MPLPRFLAACIAAALLAGCATGVRENHDGSQALAFQNPALNPRNGGMSIHAASLEPGDILLSSANGLNSVGIRLLTLSTVSHASIYTGNGQIVEAVGEGIRRSTVRQLLDEEATVVAFRHPHFKPAHADRMALFVDEQVGRKYNLLGVMLQAPFAIERRMCELPLVPALVRDFCIRGVAAVQLGIGSNDQFFCSQFVLEAYRRAGLPLTDADPRLASPADLLHMREGDVPSIRIHQALTYVGHLKFEPFRPPPAAVSVAHVHAEHGAGR